MNDHIIGWFLQTFNGLDYAKMYDITITSLKNSRYANVKLQKILIGLTHAKSSARYAVKRLRHSVFLVCIKRRI